MAWDYSRCAEIKWCRHTPEYIVIHYGVKPGTVAAPFGVWRFHKDFYPGAALDSLGLRLAPVNVRIPEKLRPEKKFDPTGHEQGRLL